MYPINWPFVELWETVWDPINMFYLRLKGQISGGAQAKYLTSPIAFLGMVVITAFLDLSLGQKTLTTLGCYILGLLVVAWRVDKPGTAWFPLPLVLLGVMIGVWF